jgi:hypothetical protein
MFHNRNGNRIQPRGWVRARLLVDSRNLRYPNDLIGPRLTSLPGFYYGPINPNPQMIAIPVHFIRESRRNSDTWDHFVAKTAIPTNLRSMPIDLRNLIWQYHGGIGSRNRWTLKSVVVKQANGWPDMDLIGLNVLQRGWIFSQMEQRGWIDYVEIRYRES